MSKNIMQFQYDWKEDILFFYSKKEYIYEFSEHLNPFIAIGFDDNNYPVDLEILDASKTLNTKKYYLKNIEKGEIVIKISENKIDLSFSLIIITHKKATTVPVTVVVANKSQIPNIQTEVAVASA